MPDVSTLTIIDSNSQFDRLRFEVVQREKLRYGERVLYRAEAGGPRMWVTHLAPPGGISIAQRRRELAKQLIAIVGPGVYWRAADSRYSDSTGAQVVWNQGEGRFA